MNIEHTLKQNIIDKAGELFMSQGYTATSIKQIAQTSRCATSALYYYFAGGKQQIWREVIRAYTLEIAQLAEVGKDAQNLEDFLLRLGEVISGMMPQLLHKFNWLMLEFASLPEEEKPLLQKHLKLQEVIQAQMLAFVPDKEQAGRLAWIVICAYFGYGQLFFTLEASQKSTLTLAEFGYTLAGVVGPAQFKVMTS